MIHSITAFLMFEGRAEEAMRHWAAVIPGAAIEELVHRGDPAKGESPAVQHAVFRLGDQRVRCFDSPAPHPFTFTPAFSFFVTCDDADEFARLAAGLGDGGRTLMPADDYGFSRRFVWLTDRFGVSWQVNLV